MYKFLLGIVLFALFGTPLANANEPVTSDLERLIGAVLGDTPMIDDLRGLTDGIGGRATGSEANLRAVEWGLERFESAGVLANKEAFTMPRAWLEVSATGSVSGIATFPVAVATRPFSTATPDGGLAAPLVDAGFGTGQDFARLGEAALGAWVLIETPVLDDEAGLAGLFQEYGDAAVIEPRAIGAGAVGIIFMSSRPKGLLYRHNAALGVANIHPQLTMEREGAKRALRLLRGGGALNFTARIQISGGGSYQAYNVIGEIPGSTRADEIVIFGAHLDSHDMGTGALDNGANVAMLIDIARQITRLGLKPKRTIRFALWNGEEMGIMGSLGYTRSHRDELDNHIVAAAFDIGTGRITGFFTNGMAALIPPVERYLIPVAGLGPFVHVNAPIVGTDNLDFMLEGVPNLVANQEDANYASNYHASSDTFDKVDQSQLRLNAAVAAAIIWGFANDEGRVPRQSRAEVEALIENTALGQQLRNMGFWNDWEEGARGRQ